MTGNPFYKTRVILSEELELKLAGRKDYDAIAIAFKRALINTASRPTLDANYSIKALANTTGSETYADTDNKKRTNTGAPTGLVEKRGGYRYIKNQKWEQGRSLYLFPRRNNRASNLKTPNFGWLEDPKDFSPEEYARAISSKPKIRFRKYKVNSKTNDVIESSEQELDPFSLNGNAVKINSSPNVKKLPGRTIGSRGSSLLHRAAGAFGVIVDAANKFRCPPGTPAANQFTDHMGSNCFGISAGEIVNFAVDQARRLDSSSGFKNNVDKFFGFLSFLDNGGIPGLGRTVWRDENGKRIKDIRKWREAQKLAQGRVFVGGMIRAQDRLKAQDAVISDLMDELGIIRTPEKTAVNDDLYEALELLRESGAWTVGVTGRLSKEDVQKVITARLNTIPGYSKLSPERQAALLRADTERYYLNERAILEGALDSFVGDPEHMRTVNSIHFRLHPDPPNEAATNIRVLPDTGRVSTGMIFDIPEIMSNQESMLPHLAPNERLRIDVVGARTDSEAASELSDFLVTVDGYSKQLAAMVEERGFARHIVKHEIAHTIQIRAFHEAIRNKIEATGSIEVKGPDGTIRKFSDIKELDGDAIFDLMTNAGDGIDLEALKNALSRADVVGFLAGDYGKEYFNDIDGPELWAIEATAELHALRDLGLIYGDDIDAALEWMDDISDAKYITERRISIEEGMEKVKESYYTNLGPDQEIIGNTVAVIRKREAEERKTRTEKLKSFAEDISTSQEEIEEALTDNAEFMDLVRGRLDAMDTAGVPKNDKNYVHNREVLDELDSHKKILERSWNKRFGEIGDGSGPKNKKAIQKAIDDIRESRGTLDGGKLAKRVNDRELEDAKQMASSSNEDEIVRKLADFEIMLKDINTSSEERQMIKEKQKIFKNAYKKLLEDSGDTRTWAAQRKELEKKIFDIVVPETERLIDKPKKFKSTRSSGNYAKQSRKELDSKLTDIQASGLDQIERSLGADGENVAGIGRIMRQSDQVSAIKDINRRHRRAQRGAAEIDGTKVDSASLEDQIDNVLIPALEAFEQAEVVESFEMDAGIYVDVDESGNTVVPETIFVPEIVKGKIITESNPHKPGIEIDSNGQHIEDRWGKTKRQKVVIQVAKGDKAVLSRGDEGTGDTESGYAMLPPGMRLRVVDRKEDGTVVARIERQESITDTLHRTSNALSDIEEGPEPWQNSKGTKKKMDRVINKYLAQRRENGLDSTPSQPKPSPAIESRNSIAERTIRETGGSFGEPPSPDYVDEVVPETGIEAIGAPQTREQRKAVRTKKIESTMDSVKDILSGKQTDEILEDATKDSIDPNVAKLVTESSPEQIAIRLNDAAVEFHEGIDKRPRVRMTEGQLDSFIESGEMLPDDPDDVKLESGAIGRRLERRIRPRERYLAANEQFASGRRTYKEQTWQEAVAKGATEEFRRLRDSGLTNGGLDNLDDETLLKQHGLKRSKQKSVLSDKPIYQTDSAEQAIALLAMGYEVEVRNKGERKMVKNAAIQTEAELKKIATEEADARGLTGNEKSKYVSNFLETHDIDLCNLYSKKTNVFCSKHIGVKRENMPQSGGPVKSANSPAMRALVGGHIAGDYAPKQGLSSEDAAKYKSLSKLLGNPKTFGEVSENDRNWVFANTDWGKVEVKTEPELMDFLSKVLPDGEKSILRTSKKPEDLYASQKQLRNAQIDKQAEGMLEMYLEARKSWGAPGSDEFKANRAKFLEQAWFQGPILTSRDGYVVDGHHRWAAIKMLNDHLPADEAIDVQVNELQTSIFESLSLAKVFQEHMEIKGKTVGKVVPFEDGETKPMSKAEFDAHLKVAQDSVQTLAQKIKDEKLYPVSVEDLAARNEPRSPGLKANRDRSVRKYGMMWKPEYSENKTVEASKSWDGWDDTPLTEIDLSSDILPTESHLKGESIDKVVSGAEPFREGYHPNLVIDVDGKMYISDGHNRVAMNRALGNEKMTARVIDLRKVEAPWGKTSKDKTNYKGYDLVEPDNPMPEAGKYPEDVVDAAVEQREKLAPVEKEITKTLIDLSEKHNSIMVGLAFRFKAIKSLARKINDERGGRTAKEAAEEMSDVIRYTMTFEPEKYVSGAKGVIEELTTAGYKLRVKNYWKAGDPYQGINIAAVHPNGTRFELQFHTPQSATEKEVIHKVYDEYKIETDPKKRWKLYDRMTRMAERINVPLEDGLEEIGETKTQEFSPTREAPSIQKPNVPSFASGRRDKINKRGGLVDRFILEKRKVGDEARTLKFDTESISSPTKITRDEFARVVGSVPGISKTDELIETEKLTSSRVPGLDMFRGIYNGKNGKKNRVFGKYTAPNGNEYSITNDADGFEGVYYAYPGGKRLPESERVAKLTLILNDGELNVHDLFDVDVKKENRKVGLAQAMVEVAKADFPEATFTTRRVITSEGAQFARNIQNSRGTARDGELNFASGRSFGKQGGKVSGILSSRVTDRIVDAALRRSGADEQTKERVKYGMQLATALAAGGPTGFATVLAADTARRAGREIAERVLEEAVERGHLSAEAAEMAMRRVDKIAPDGLPDEVVEKLSDAWFVGSEFLDTRVFNEENAEKVRDVVESAKDAATNVASRVRGRMRNRRRTTGSNLVENPIVETDQSMPNSEFGSGRVAGRAANYLNKEYQSRIGIAKEMPSFNRPVSGYVVHRSHDEEKKRRVKMNGSGNVAPDAIFEIGNEDIVGDGLTAFGDIELVLRPGVSQRTAYGRGDSISSAHRPVMMNSTDPDDIADALLNTDGINNKNKDANAMLHMLKASIDKNYASVNAGRDEDGRMAPVGKLDPSNRPHEPFEAHILGGFKKDEVEGIHYPFSRIQKLAEGEDISDIVNEASIRGRLEKLGFTPEEIAYFYSISDSSMMNTPSMQKLREYRAAKRVKQKYEKAGLEYVRIAHPTGINIENPRTYDKNALGNENVGLMLQKQIISEMDEELKKTLNKMRKPGGRELIA